MMLRREFVVTDVDDDTVNLRDTMMLRRNETTTKGRASSESDVAAEEEMTWILANRQSSAQLMKMRIRYIIEWRKLKKLKIKVAKLIAKLAMLKRDCIELAEENKESMMRLEALTQEAQLQDEVYQAQLEEIQSLKEKLNWTKLPPNLWTSISGEEARNNSSN
ncbi:hypothetical protein JHK82_025648 [Glycine max]|nr:hypothetical protein JHK82_025648 [Glycine max]RZB92901.1 putative transcription factor PosF21 [Glycine soja]